jgi:hypothetical protein
VDPQDETGTDRPRSDALFRPSPLVILAALAFAFCATPFAFGAPLFWLVYLVPVGVIAWAVRTRTVVDAEGVTVRRVLSRRRVPWVDITALRLAPRTPLRAATVNAVLTDGAELPLPAVHVRHLSQLAAASAGRLPDPAGE